MTDSKKPITIKMFLHRSSSRAAVAAEGFLSKYHEFLSSPEIGPIAGPILAQVKAGTLMPTPALAQLRDAVFAYKVQKDIAEANAKLAKASETAEDKPSSYKWQTIVYDPRGKMIVHTRKDAEGNIEHYPLDRTFKFNQHAEGWADRELFDEEPGSYAVITHNPTGAQETIERSDSIARIMKAGKRPVVRNGSPSSSLSFGVKSKPTRVTFSAG
jgi:hypothetical protein